MTIKEAKELMNWSKQAFYYYKRTGKIHVVNGQINDNEIWAIYDNKIKPVSKSDQDKMRVSLLKIGFELNNKKEITLYDIAYALLASNLLSPQQTEILIETLEL